MRIEPFVNTTLKIRNDRMAIRALKSLLTVTRQPNGYIEFLHAAGDNSIRSSKKRSNITNAESLQSVKFFEFLLSWFFSPVAARLRNSAMRDTKFIQPIGNRGLVYLIQFCDFIIGQPTYPVESIKCFSIRRLGAMWKSSLYCATARNSITLQPTLDLLFVLSCFFGNLFTRKAALNVHFHKLLLGKWGMKLSTIWTSLVVTISPFVKRVAALSTLVGYGRHMWQYAILYGLSQ